MAVYNPPDPRFEGTYNPSYFIGKEDEKAIEQTGTILTGDFIRRDGSSIMTGGLMTPAITLFNDGRIVFKDDTVQNTAFTDIQNTLLTSNNQKTTNISFDDTTDITNISNSLKVSKIIFSGDNNSEQSISFNLSNRNDINASKLKLTNTAYDQSLNKTTINNNCHINNLTTGNFNTSFLSNINTDVHTELLKIKQITNVGQITTINGQTSTNIVNLFGDGITGRQLKFYDGSTPSVQTSAFTETHKTDLNNIKNNTQKIFYHDTIEAPNTTEINGSIATNNIRLYEGNLTFSDGTVQTTASSSNGSDLTNINNKIQNISFSEPQTTTIIGDVVISKIIMNNFEQEYAFTTAHRNKLEWLNINEDFFLVNKIKFLDDTEQTTAFTTFLRSLLFSNQGNVATLQDKTQNISRAGTITSITDATYTPIISIGTQINFPNGSVQTQAFDTSWMNKIDAPMNDASKSNVLEKTINLFLPSSGNNFITSTKSVWLTVLGGGLNYIEGVVSVLNINSITKILCRLRADPLTSSPYVGLNRQSADSEYTNFRNPIFWIVNVPQGSYYALYIDIDYSYKPNSNLTSEFNFRVCVLK